MKLRRREGFQWEGVSRLSRSRLFIPQFCGPHYVSIQKNIMSDSTQNPQNPNPSPDDGFKPADWIALINLVVVIIGGILGYQLIESTKLSIEEARAAMERTKTTIDVSKFMNDLRPAVNDQCSAWATSATTLNVVCTVKNVGAQRIVIATPTTQIKNKETGEIISTYFNYLRAPSGNALPVNTEGTISYSVTAKQPVDWRRIEVITNYQAQTDPIIVSVAKSTLKEFVDEASVSKLSSHGMTFTSFVDTKALQQTTPTVSQ